MVALPNPTVDAIFSTYERNHKPWVREHIGGSDIGRQCDRRLWLAFRQVAIERPEGRILRLFNTGHRFEAVIIQDLKDAGITVWDKDPATGKQWEFSALDGHVVVHLDGVAQGFPEAPETPHLLEVKSMNKKNFDKLEKDGVEKSKPEYFAQMQLGMGLADLDRAAFICSCKDDERIYFERVPFDGKAFKDLMLRAAHIVKSETPPERISKDPAFWVCKFCPFNAHCHGEAIAAANCRTCVHASPAASGGWECANGLAMAPGCGEHVFIPDLLSFAVPIDGDPSWIKYKIPSTGREFVNCADSGFPADDVAHYSSRELVNCTPAAIGDPRVEAARAALGGEVVESRSAKP